MVPVQRAFTCASRRPFEHLRASLSVIAVTRSSPQTNTASTPCSTTAATSTTTRASAPSVTRTRRCASHGSQRALGVPRMGAAPLPVRSPRRTPRPRAPVGDVAPTHPRRPRMRTSVGRGPRRRRHTRRHRRALAAYRGPHALRRGPRALPLQLLARERDGAPRLLRRVAARRGDARRGGWESAVRRAQWANSKAAAPLEATILGVCPHRRAGNGVKSNLPIATHG